MLRLKVSLDLFSDTICACFSSVVQVCFHFCFERKSTSLEKKMLKCRVVRPGAVGQLGLLFQLTFGQAPLSPKKKKKSKNAAVNVHNLLFGRTAAVTALSAYFWAGNSLSPKKKAKNCCDECSKAPFRKNCSCNNVVESVEKTSLVLDTVCSTTQTWRRNKHNF